MKYEIVGKQGLYQKGSNEQVLANKLDITDPDDMDEAELILLDQLSEDILINHLPQQALTIKEIKNWHYRWLGNIYEWAGEERSVNLSKDGFQFAAAPQISKLLTSI